MTDGAAGLNGVAAPRMFGYSFGVAATPYYYVAIAMVALLIFVSVRLRDSRIGRAWMAIREDEIAAARDGYRTCTRSKLLAFAIGAAFAGMTGTFYVAKLQTATPEMFGFPVSVMILVMVVLGGIGSVWGVVLGAFVLQLLQSWWLEDLTGWLHALGRLVGNGWLQRVDLVAVDRADLRPGPGGDDAVPPPGADPGDARGGGAELRAAARRKLQRGGFDRGLARAWRSGRTGAVALEIRA